MQVVDFCPEARVATLMRQGFDISHAVVRTGGLLYTSAGAIVADKYSGDNLGVRITMLVPHPLRGTRLRSTTIQP